MKLLSATVKNYRAHRETSVVFDGESLLIAGPNEAGKSTLAEAIHRALFLKGKVSGALLESMKSLTHGGDPYVCVSFLDDSGNACRIEKIFGKSNTLLHLPGREPLSGDAADEELARRLGVADTIDGKGWETKLSRRWAHLWVRQGASGTEPFGSVEEENQKLFSRLQELGGAALQASDFDVRVSRDFREKADTLWVSKGKPKAGSAYARACADQTDAEEHAARAVETLAKLETAIDTWREAEATLAEKERDRKKHETETAISQEALEKVKRLDTDLELLGAQTSPIRSEHDRLLKADKLIADRRNEIVAAAADVEKLRPRFASADEAVDLLTKKLAGDKTCVDAATARSGQARLAVDRLTVAMARVDAAREVADLETLAVQVDTLKKEIEEADLALEKLPKVTTRHLKALNNAKEAFAVSRAALNAAGVRIRLVASDETLVAIAGRPLGLDEVSLTEESELCVGTKVRLRISPGGSGDLRKARTDFAAAEKEFEAALAPFGVTGVEEALAVLEKVNAQQEILKARETALKALNPEALAERLGKARARLARARGECDRLTVPEGLLVNDDTLKTAALERTEAERAEVDALAFQKKTDTDLATARQNLADLKKDFDTRTSAVDSAQVSLRTLVTEYGEDDPRRDLLGKLRRDLASREDQIHSLEEERASYQPDLLRDRLARLDRSLKQNEESVRQARDRRAGAEAVLRHDGSTDPVAEMEITRLAAARAAARTETERVEAEAVKLLADLFDKHRATVAKEGAKPLAEAANRYLSHLHGVGTTVTLSLGEQGGAFEGVALSRRDGTTFNFNSLSGGAKEQVGIALRLAMTETLAASHGNALPVVLDDAFVNSDKDRVAAVLDMLDLAGRRGLQVIVFTCHPEQYSGMGWKEHRLVRQAPSSSRPAVERPLHEPEADETSPTDSPSFSAHPSVSGDSQARFIAILEREGGRASSRSLREELDCSPEAFNAIRESLGNRIITEARSIKLA